MDSVIMNGNPAALQHSEIDRVIVSIHDAAELDKALRAALTL